MQKRRILAALLLIAVLLLTGCKGNVEKYDANISELRTDIFAAENAQMRVTAITGRRENPYVMDGQSDQKQPFTVVTIVPASFTAGKQYGYVAVIDGKEYAGEFLPHPFAERLSADIPAMCGAKELSLTVISGEQRDSFTLQSVVTGETLSAEKALGIALNKLHEPIESFRSGGRLNAEIYLRLTENPIDNTGGYFWYVAFVGEGQVTYAVLLDCVTGDVVAIRD